MTKHEHTQEERLLAGLAHASVVTGAIAPVVGLLIYFNQKEKSSYVAGQALQAVFYQLSGLIVITLVWLLWGIFYALSFFPLIMNPEQYQDAPPPIFWVGLASIILPFAVMGIWALYGLYGSLRTWLDQDFHYILVNRLGV
jgi:uncharacterized Tic20 family protein